MVSKVNESANLEAAIRVSGIRKSFETKEVLRGIDLEIPDGAYATLLGPSGSGKTTLLRIIAGFTSAEEGTVSISGVDITDRPAKERNIGMVFQNYALFPHLTAKENIEYPLRVRKIPQRQRSQLALQYLERVQLADWADHYPRELSGGQQQRVALARGLVYGPKLLLLDEPLGALDKHLRVDMQEFLKELQRDLGITFVHVTHDQSEALALSTLVVIIRDGMLEQMGSPEDIYLYPASQFVAGFIGDSNIVRCTVSERLDTIMRVVLHDGAAYDIPLSVRLCSALQAGEDALLVLRPEDASTSETTGSDWVRMSGDVLRTTFMGTYYDVVIKTHYGEITARLKQDYARGGRIVVAWPANKCVVLSAQ